MIANLQVGSSYTPSENDSLVYSYWDKIKLYNLWSNNDENLKTFNFYDGPPFVSSDGLHYGHTLVSFIKDFKLQYARQMGYNVSNIQGYDTHGLPIELRVNDILKLKTREDILEYGVANYNQVCRDTINSYKNSWRPVFESVGRITSESSYITMSTEFMENVWRVFYEINKLDLVYRGFRVMPYSPACSTPLSNFEAGQNYKDINTRSVYVLFPLVCSEISYFNKTFPFPNNYTDTVYVVAWTTTPWTLPANMALCVNANENYVVIYVKDQNKIYLVAENMITSVFNNYTNTDTNYKILDRPLGVSLIGEEYIPLYNYSDTITHTFKIIDDLFVQCKSGENGSGIVHLAPAFGEDDMRVCLANNINNIFVNVDDNGKLICNLVDSPNSVDFGGKFYKDVNKLVIKNLTERGLVLKCQDILHSYPHCWRTDTELIYRAQDCWFISVSKLKDRLVANNKTVNWFPSHVGTGRFHEWLNNAKDWCISRNRVFGTPIPIWLSSSGKYVVVRDVEHLCELSSKSISDIWGDKNVDLHSEFIDHITFTIDGETYKRVDTLFDCWFESGCVPMAMNGKFSMDNPPPVADFICEGIDQTRGWFYTLMVLSTALFDRAPFKNVMCSGLILAQDGKKMSKRLNNFTDPRENLSKFGGDSVRLYMLGMPATSADSTKFNDSDIIAKTKSNQQWLNSFKFLAEHIQMYESATTSKLSIIDISTLSNEFDLWIISLLHTTQQKIMDNFNNFNSINYINLVYDFIEAYTNWYLKFNRFRLKGKSGNDDWVASLNTCIYITNLFNLICTPVMPFMSETIYHNLTNLNINSFKEPSTRLNRFPTDKTYTDTLAERKFSNFVKCCDIIRQLRAQANLGSAKLPIKSVKVYSNNIEIVNDLTDMLTYFTNEEINVINVDIIGNVETKYEITANPRSGSFFRKDLGAFKKYLTSLTSNDIQNLTSPFSLTLGYNTYTITSEHYIITTKSNILTGENTLSMTNNDMTVVLDKTQDSEVYMKHFIRMLVYETQHIRKECGIRPWNKLHFTYQTIDTKLIQYIQENLDYLKKTLCYSVSVNLDNTNTITWCKDQTITYNSPDQSTKEILLTIYNCD